MQQAIYLVLFGFLSFLVGVFALIGWKGGLIVLGILAFLFGCVGYLASKEEE